MYTVVDQSETAVRRWFSESVGETGSEAKGSASLSMNTACSAKARKYCVTCYLACRQRTCMIVKPLPHSHALPRTRQCRGQKMSVTMSVTLHPSVAGALHATHVYDSSHPSNLNRSQAAYKNKIRLCQLLPDSHVSHLVVLVNNNNNCLLYTSDAADE